MGWWPQNKCAFCCTLLGNKVLEIPWILEKEKGAFVLSSTGFIMEIGAQFVDQQERKTIEEHIPDSCYDVKPDETNYYFF